MKSELNHDFYPIPPSSVTNAKSTFPNDEPLTKPLFLAYRDLSKKWKMTVRAYIPS